MKIAAVQHDILWERPEENRRRLEPVIAEAAASGARVVVLAEMYSTGFAIATADRIAEPPGGDSERFLVDLARRLDVWLIASVPQRAPGAALPTNTGLVVAPDGGVHRYEKLHPFSHAGEDRHYSPGAETLTVDVDGLSVSLFICYDLRFADWFWRLADHTDCYVVIANWPRARRNHWNTLLAARAIENQAYVVGVNRVGAEPSGLDYAGDSQIVDPAGRVLVKAAETETVLTEEVDPATVARYRDDFPALRDRRGS
ncbi:putative amidohydrolase [Stackebrandtia albiflava]|uniref:Putative amidohydrolase n=1 Tax=Stackebrandtia albiflava TaxID=406432 RepID=A0A562VCE9_9ACTN|nr:carbon-nitrogen family hydrolase [Stackebrandtia albiflava]TWJ15491.1 putative amidohydrolase [Stackebrandtia albiflava]